MNRQQGIALPVALILFVVMMIGALYLARSSTSSALVVSNLAYQKTLSRAADLGLLRGNDLLSQRHQGGPLLKASLDNDIAGQGYVAAFPNSPPGVPTFTPLDAQFWVGSVTVNDIQGSGFNVEYVIHRLCSLKQPFAFGGNQCVISHPTVSTPGGLDADPIPPPADPPLIHYLITSRVVNSQRGSSVTNQMVVMLGA